MGVRIPVSVLLLLGVLCTTTTAFIPDDWRRDSGTACERLQEAGMSVYATASQYFFGPGTDMGEYGPERISEILCDVAGARTLNDVTDAINPNLPPFIRDTIQLYYIVGTSVIEFLGGLDGIEIRVNFVRAWADFARNTLAQGPVSYDVAYEFTSSLVETYGADFLKTMAKGTLLVALGPNGPLLDENDVLQPEMLARALSENLNGDVFAFSETSGLSVATSTTVQNIVFMMRSPMAEHIYPMYSHAADSALVFLRTLDDLQLLDLELAA